MNNTGIVKPLGWLRKFLETQMDGLTGHIEEAGFPYDTVEWGGTEKVYNNGKPEWWVLEQTAYWIDGYTRTAILLDDGEAIARAERMIYRVLDNPDSDGYLGPKILKVGEHFSRWPHVVFFRACMALYDYNSDEGIVNALTRHYLAQKDNGHVWRDVNNVEIMLWLYGINGNEKLLEYAESAYLKYNARRGSDSIDEVALSHRKPYEHGVSHNEYSKLGAILYSHTGKGEYLKASVSAYRKAERYFMLPGGCICSNEYMLNNKYYQSYETCNVSDMTWSMAYLLRITKASEWGDKIERCIFNAGLGTVLEDFRALQYYSAANQVISDSSSNHNNHGYERAWMRYSPNPGTACCPGNLNRFMPNYVLNSWYREGNTIYSMLFGSSEFSCSVDGLAVNITEETSYPFESTVRYRIKAEAPFTLCIRKPRYATEVTVDCREGVANVRKRADFYECRITGDTLITVNIKSAVEEVKSAPGVYLRKGALVFSLPIKEERATRHDADTAGHTFPAYDIRPDSEWRYALIGGYSFNENSFTSLCDKESAPYISVRVKRITNLLPDKNDPYADSTASEPSYRDYTFTPKLQKTEDIRLDDTELTVKLLPYGMCKLRMTVMNKV